MLCQWKILRFEWKRREKTQSNGHGKLWMLNLCGNNRIYNVIEATMYTVFVRPTQSRKIIIKQFCTLNRGTSNEIEPVIGTSFYSESCDNNKKLFRFADLWFQLSRISTRISTMSSCWLVDKQIVLYNWNSVLHCSFDSLSLVYLVCVIIFEWIHTELLLHCDNYLHVQRSRQLLLAFFVTF